MAIEGNLRRLRAFASLMFVVGLLPLVASFDVPTYVKDHGMPSPLMLLLALPDCGYQNADLPLNLQLP